MKKLFRVLLCGVLMAAALSVSAFAVEDDILLISPGPTTIAPPPLPCPNCRATSTCWSTAST